MISNDTNLMDLSYLHISRVMLHVGLINHTSIHKTIKNDIKVHSIHTSKHSTELLVLYVRQISRNINVSREICRHAMKKSTGLSQVNMKQNKY